MMVYSKFFGEYPLDRVHVPILSASECDTIFCPGRVGKRSLNYRTIMHNSYISIHLEVRVDDGNIYGAQQEATPESLI